MAIRWRPDFKLPQISLDAAGLIALAELTMVARHTALKGTAYYLDALVLCPGLHRQQAATSLNAGEFPITANMTSGYVFRVENQATVHYLQSVSRTGYLTSLHVKEETHILDRTRPMLDVSAPLAAAVFTALPMLSTLAALALLILARDFWALGILALLVLARLVNVVLVRRRCDASWHGVKEPGQKGDLLILLSQDRWVRMQGLTDDLKAVTSGQWLRDSGSLEGAAEGAATVIVYLSAALASNASEAGKIVFLVLLLLNAGFLAASNACLRSLHMKGRVVRTLSKPRMYKRRLDMANELVKESGRKDWAFKIGLISEDPATIGKEEHRKGKVQV